MQISEILTQSAVKTVSAVTSKKRLFQEVAELATVAHDMPTDRTLEALLERESLGPTGVGHGVALPHARLDCLDKVVAVFLRLERPLDFDATDRQPVDLFFALFAPEQAGVDHLKALALASRTMRSEEICTKLRANTKPAALHAILTESEESQAA
ncbi:phosphotransferase IIA-like nitrogen-regulatory protein PtsN [Litoreibacter ponti]|uniref:Phosphotransferase IIA-like nitrogen-regulatory protein PtsN n=1 Tax=Litoreibacter ponti TaxID=1510457 RepID=A0A2T6BP96_9RHOB|nr:PTS sugar transporter subunit IIA [Litoreibacter ponti]PTX57908.1 phosphotransferase IIA-like nitrogen-regulatory protein PtsN [Litoreibacter ponti]